MFGQKFFKPLHVLLGSLVEIVFTIAAANLDLAAFIGEADRLSQVAQLILGDEAEFKGIAFYLAFTAVYGLFRWNLGFAAVGIDKRGAGKEEDGAKDKREKRFHELKNNTEYVTNFAAWSVLELHIERCCNHEMGKEALIPQKIFYFYHMGLLSKVWLSGLR